ncbi:MAG: CARDB domain-containing protein, partial [Actinomycetota bacterium]
SHADGSYRFSRLTSGTYFLRFSSYSYTTTWYNGKDDYAGADPIVLTAPNEATDIDVVMRAPDLVIDSFEYPEFVAIGGSVEFTYTIRNAGDGPVDASWVSDRVYLSDDTQLNTYYDVTTATHSHEQLQLEPGETLTITLTGTVPSSLGLGQKYFILRLDNWQNIPEPDRTNNIIVSEPITVGAPDLTITSVEAPDAASGGQQITVSWTVENIGSDPASVSGWYDAVLLSSDTVVSGDDTWLTDVWTSAYTPLAAGASYTIERTFTLPSTATGNLYLLFVTDRYNYQGETNENNNLVAHPISLNAPDLAMTAATAPTAAILGETISVSWTVENLGEHPALASWLDRVYLSTATTFNPDTDTLVYSHNPSAHRPLAAGATYTVERDLLLPEGPTGSLYLLFVTDATGVQGEINEGNNVVAKAITVTAPDLTVTDFDAPSEALLSETLSVTWTVRNNGSQPALAGWTDRLYLSPNPDAVGAGSFWVASEARSDSLAAGADYTVTRDVTVPTDVDLGSWYWVIVT